MNSAQKAYRCSDIETASPAKLVLALYDGALSALRRALADIGARRWAEAHRQIVKTQDILGELAGTLDFKSGGEVAPNLFRLYDFMITHLVRANLTKDPALIEQVAALLGPLRDGWEEGVVRSATVAGARPDPLAARGGR
ncbi:MAG TPA: flagellar export chaperone FliS [Elusimicrobiota bacterium]|nr:flagellar export chaperone FliS [Elusimicrobiota bacterium]HMZ26733.1 flagellar export chaperone FliS [Elusimicrobiota bacterium]HNC74282.1 flagellar export chaperone FliS [Elusimicrobiota bacterium]HND64716.1 flagellar export chaperone FliS [Elusimicrobiota bacterium]